MSMSIYFIFLDIMVQVFLNVFEKGKHLNTMRSHWVVQIRLTISAICFLGTTVSFIENHPIFFVSMQSNWTTNTLVVKLVEPPVVQLVQLCRQGGYTKTTGGL